MSSYSQSQTYFLLSFVPHTHLATKFCGLFYWMSFRYLCFLCDGIAIILVLAPITQSSDHHNILLPGFSSVSDSSWYSFQKTCHLAILLLKSHPFLPIAYWLKYKVDRFVCINISSSISILCMVWSNWISYHFPLNCCSFSFLLIFKMIFLFALEAPNLFPSIHDYHSIKIRFKIHLLPALVNVGHTLVKIIALIFIPMYYHMSIDIYYIHTYINAYTLYIYIYTIFLYINIISQKPLLLFPLLTKWLIH